MWGGRRRASCNGWGADTREQKKNRRDESGDGF